MIPRRVAVVLRWLPVPGLAGVGMVVGSPLLAVAAPLVVVLGLLEWSRRRRWRAAGARIDSLPSAIDHVIQQLNAGASLRQACRSLDRSTGEAASLRGRWRSGSTGSEPLAPLVQALVAGRPLADAALVLAEDDDPSVRLVATTLGQLAADGGPAVPALRRLRHALVGRSHRRYRADAVAAGATSSAGMLALAPALFALVLAGAEPAVARFYTFEVVGAACAVTSVLLSAGGWWWIRAAVARSVGAGA